MFVGWFLFMCVAVVVVNVFFVFWLSRARCTVVCFPGLGADFLRGVGRRLCGRYGLVSGFSVVVCAFVFSGGFWVLRLVLAGVVGYFLGVLWGRLRLRGFVISEPVRVDSEGVWVLFGLDDGWFDCPYGRIGVLPLWVDVLAVVVFSVVGLVLGLFGCSGVW